MSRNAPAQRQPFRRPLGGSLALFIISFTALFISDCFIQDAQGSELVRREEAHRGFVDQPSLSRETIVFHDGPATMSFPRNYLTSVYTPAGTDNSINIVGLATFPSIQGNSAETINCFHFSMLRKCDIIAFQYTGIRKQGSAAFQSRRDFLLGNNTGRQEFAFGLLRTPMRNSYLYVDDEKEELIPVSCSEFTSICSMHLDVSGTRWRLLFKVDFLDRWCEIADKFKAFFESRIHIAGAGKN
jgi:hypothetical protein